MKPTTLLLATSLVANAALVAYLAIHPAAAPAESGRTAISSPTVAPGDAKNYASLRAALAAGDAAALEAAGIPREVARELVIGRIFSRFADKMRAANAKSGGDDRWWRSRPSATSSREQQLLARREFTDALVAAFGDDLGLANGEAAQLGFLAPEKRDALRHIIQDYDEMIAKFSTGSMQLASDREKLRLLRQERDRDIAALLTPEERVAYEMRTSASGLSVRNRYGDAIESDAEFQKIYALQKAFDEKYPRDALVGRIPPEVLQARAAAERQLDADLRAAVGDDRYSALHRAADPDVRTIDSLAARLNLPSSTTDNVLASRDGYSTESQRIVNDASLSMPERRAQIQALATQAKSELTRALGAEAAEAYAQRSPWVNLLQNGMAYSTTPQEGTMGMGNQSIYPVMPAGSANAQRQFVVNAAPPSDGAGGDTLFGGGGGREAQVMTFSSSTTTDRTPAPAGAGGPRQITTPPAQTPPAQTNQPTPQPRP